MSQKSILAKLLATENITVQHGNYETAWFDIKNRVLGLPQWVDNGKDVSDLLIGHEVGHALETPFEGWHDSPEKLDGCPRTYINVVEDARIERKIKSRYIGLVGPFQRGYKKLFEDGFFGEDHDFDNMKLIDKINLKAKVGAHLSIPFNPEEEALYNATMNTDTFDEVIQVVKDILAYTKEHTPELLTPPPPPESDEMEGDMEGEKEQSKNGPSSGGHDDMETPEQEQTKQESADGEDSDDRKETNNSSSRSDDEETPSAEDSTPTQKSEDDVSQTDEAFRNNERDLVDKDENGHQHVVMTGLSKQNVRAAVIDYKSLMKQRAETIEKTRTIFEGDDSMYGYSDYESYRKGFKEYLADAKRSVNYAIKEFEQRKAAFRWTRAETARTGSINVNKLWAYKTDDDIFARVTRLADAKNHGLIGMIDYSGSMCGTMGNVLDQVVHLGLFCKGVNIPFDIYGFTTENARETFKQIDGEIYSDGLSLPQILSSSMKKSEFEEAMYHCYVRREMNNGYYFDDRYILSEKERYGSTPLNQALNVTSTLVQDFKRKHATDKMNVVLITDGDTNRSHPHHDYSVVKDDNRTSSRYYNSDVIFHQHGRTLKAKNSGRGLTKALLKDLQETYNATTIGFFISNGHYEYKNQIARVFTEATNEDEWTDEYREFYKDAQKQYRQNKCFISNSVEGYDEYYVLKDGNNLQTKEEEFAPDADATKGQITAAFKKHSKSKKNNKVLLTNFGRAVA